MESPVFYPGNAFRQQQTAQALIAIIAIAWHSGQARGTTQVNHRTGTVVIGDGEIVTVDLSSHNNLGNVRCVMLRYLVNRRTQISRIKVIYDNLSRKVIIRIRTRRLRIRRIILIDGIQLRVACRHRIVEALGSRNQIALCILPAYKLKVGIGISIEMHRSILLLVHLAGIERACTGRLASQTYLIGRCSLLWERREGRIFWLILIYCGDCGITLRHHVVESRRC